MITRPVGLDFTAVMMVGAAARVDMAMLADVLPGVEAAIVNPGSAFEEGGDDGD